jgi:hypothetical protein
MYSEKYEGRTANVFIILVRPNHPECLDHNTEHWTLHIPTHSVVISQWYYLPVFYISSYPQGGEEEEGEDAVNVDSEGEMEDEDNAAYSAEVMDDSDEEPEMAPPPKKKSKKGSQWESL